MAKVLKQINKEVAALEAELCKPEPSDAVLEWHYRKIMSLNAMIQYDKADLAEMLSWLMPNHKIEREPFTHNVK